MKRAILGIEFDDLHHGLGVLFEADSPDSRMHIAKIIAQDLETLPSGTALNDFITRLYPTLAFGDVPSPALRDDFTQLVIAYSGWSADRMIAKKQQEIDRANGKKGGRGKLPGTPSFNTKDAELVREFNKVRPISKSDTDAAERMINAGFVDLDGKKLSAETIRRRVRNWNKKTTNKK